MLLLPIGVMAQDVTISSLMAFNKVEVFNYKPFEHNATLNGC